MITHIIRIVFESMLLLMAVLTLYVNSKIFKVFSLVLSIILVLLNAYHLVSTFLHELGDYSQHAILLVIFTANILLVLEFRKWLKETA